MRSDTNTHSPNYPTRMPPYLPHRDGFTGYSLPVPVNADTTLSFKYATYFTHALEPLPQVVKQTDDHYVVFAADVAHLPSAYTTQTASTTVKLGTKQAVKSFEPKEATPDNSGNFKLGPFSHINAWESAPLRVHYKSTAKFVTMEEVEREVEVSLWGNVAVEEHFSCTHTGAELQDGLFSRVDYMMRQAVGASWDSLTGKLPVHARDLYYRDVIGNISTSTVTRSPDATKLTVFHRYPMFGGWKTQWYQGYNVPASDFLQYNAAENKYYLEFPALPAFDAATNAYKLAFVLPEGATDITVETPFPETNRTEYRRFTYLDMQVGRPVITVHASQVVPAHKGNAVVTFRMPSGFMLREPAMLVSAVLACFIAYIAISRLHLTIT